MAKAGRSKPCSEFDTAAAAPSADENRAGPGPEGDSPVAAYKTILQRVLDNRPSGTRLRLASVLGKNRSFVSQITNPSYGVPLPARHVATVLEACHLSASEREQFLAAYAIAHPERRSHLATAKTTRTLTLTVPDFGDARRNRAFDDLVSDMAERMGRFGSGER